jgi:hypothetical protein
LALTVKLTQQTESSYRVSYTTPLLLRQPFRCVAIDTEDCANKLAVLLTFQPERSKLDTTKLSYGRLHQTPAIKPDIEVLLQVR